MPSLTLNYRPAEPTGWPPASPTEPVGATLGGHTVAADFAVGAAGYRVSLLPELTDPVYAPVPTDPALDSARVLDDAFGVEYAFRYAGGLTGGSRLEVRSYTVRADSTAGGVAFGVDLYVVLRPGRGGPEEGALRWIQVIRQPGPDGTSTTSVDNAGRANPFHPTSGWTSVNGAGVDNFAYRAGMEFSHAGPPIELPVGETRAEAFLVEDTGRRDRTGRGLVRVLGGLRHGWQLTPLSRLAA